MGPICRLAPANLEELRRQLEELFEKGRVETSSSPYGAPVLFVEKKDDTLCMCVDDRKLNNVIVKNSYPLPRIHDLLDQLHCAKVFSSIDLRSGYHPVRIKDGDEHKTAFWTQYGHFQFCVLPLKLCNAPATFQRLMNDVFKPFFLNFLLQEHKLYIKRSKCEFAISALRFLGHVISDRGIYIHLEKVRAILEWPETAGTPAQCKTQKKTRKKSLRRPKAACIKGRSPNWKAKGLTRRPSKPTLDTASLGESQKNLMGIWRVARHAPGRPDPPSP
eukprot:1140554-Pelagomonas_calceolata.AAC.1